MLAFILRTVYIDPELVAKEYLQRCKVGAWKTKNTEDALKCWNLERILDAESYGITLPAELTLDDLVNEERETTEQVIVIDEDIKLITLNHLDLSKSKIAHSSLPHFSPRQND